MGQLAGLKSLLAIYVKDVHVPKDHVMKSYVRSKNFTHYILIHLELGKR